MRERLEGFTGLHASNTIARVPRARVRIQSCNAVERVQSREASGDLNPASPQQVTDPPAMPDGDGGALRPPAEGRLTVTVTLTSQPRDVPPEIRLRRLLKTALRTFGFRASWPADQAKGEAYKS